jgi:hypothetical protein
MKKIAKKSSFDESVPSTGLGMNQDETQGNAQPEKKSTVDPSSDQYAAVPADQSQGDPNQQVPQESAVPPGMVQAAQAFLGPEVMAAAMQGDPNAQDLVAKAAAQFGSAFMNMSANTGVSAQPSMDASGMPQGVPGQPPMTPMGITSPEEDLAAELVPNVPAPQQAVPGQQQAVPGQPQEATSPFKQAKPVQPGQATGVPPNTEGESPEDQNKELTQEQSGQQPVQGQEQGGDQVVDIATVVKLINLVKSGKI